MASYIQGLTDVPVPVEPFQPDFGMVQKALTTLQGRYEQGFASVKNAYSQVLNAPITNSKLRGQRDAYVKVAGHQLRNLSSVDLSIAENQAAAEGVFSPFWEDNRMLMDASLTKSYKREMDRGFAVRDSTDDKVREQYNDLSIRYLQNGLDSLRDTDPDSTEFGKLQGRRWVPFHNLEKYLDEQAKEEKLEIKWKSANGPYLVNISNGQRAKDPFKNWAHNKLGNNFSEQFRVMGIVEKEEGVKELMANDPSLTKEQALSSLATNVMTRLQKGYSHRDSEITDSLREIDAKMEPLLNKKLSDDTDQAEIEELLSLDKQRTTLAEQQTALGKEREKFEKNAPQTFTDILRSPDNYFANVNKERVVNGWATGRAGIESVDIDLNPALKEQNENDYRKATLKYNYAKLDLDERIFQAKLVDTDGDGEPDTYLGGRGGGGLGGDGTRVKKGDGSKQTLSSGMNEGAGITDITQTGSAMDVYRQEQGSRLYTANENFLSQDGVARVLTAKLGFSALDARDFLSEVRRGVEDPDHKLADNERFTPMLTALEKESGMKIDGGIGVRNALVAVAGNYVAEKLKGGGKNMSDGDRLMIKKYRDGIDALQAYNASNTQAQEAIKKTLAASTVYAPLKITRSDGKIDVMGVDDVAKFFPEASYAFEDKQSKRTFVLTRQELAQFYVDGKISSAMTDDSPTLSTLTIDGKKVKQVNFKYPNNPDRVRSFDPADFNPVNDVEKGFQGLKEKFVTSWFQGGWKKDAYGSKRFKDLTEKLGQQIGPFLPEFESKTGKYGVRLKYDLRSDVDNEFSYRLLSELRNTDNRLGITYDGKTDADLDEAVLNLLNQGEPVMEKYISAIHITTTGGPHGHPVVEFSVAPVKDTDKTDITDDVELKKLAQQKNISIELNPNASGALSRNVRFNSGLYMYGGLLHGEVFKSDAILEAAGFKYSVMPNDDRNPSYVTIEMERTVFDDKTGKNKPLNKWTSERIYFNDRTPDQVMAKINGYLDAHLQGNAEANTRYETAAKTNVMMGRDRLKRRA